MLRLGKAKRAIRRAIARHHRAPLITKIHEVAAFIESAWHNDDLDLESDGERFVLERLGSASFCLAIDVGANIGDWTAEAMTQLAELPRTRLRTGAADS